MARRLPDIVLVALVVLHLVAVWSFRYLPTQDGPAHLANARMLLDAWQGSHPSAAPFFVPRLELVPNLLGHALLMGLMSWLPAGIAEKLLVSGYLVLFPLAVRYTLGGFHRGARAFTLLAMPLLTSYLFHLGFYNFCFGVGLGLVALGFWWRRRDRMSLAAATGLGALFLLLAFTHLVAMAVAWGMIVLLALLGPRSSSEAGSAGGGWRGALDRATLPTLTVLPALGLALPFLARAGDGEVVRLPATVLLRMLVSLDVLVSYQPAEYGMSFLFAAVLVVATGTALVARRRGGSRVAADGLLILAAVLVALFFLVPNRLAGGSWMSHRLCLYPPLVGVMWLAVQPWSPGARRLLLMLGVAVTLGFLGLHATSYLTIGNQLKEYASVGSRMQPGETLLPVTFASRGRDSSGSPLSIKTKPFRNAAGHLVATRGVVDLTSYEAFTGHFPVQPGPALAGAEVQALLERSRREPPQVDFERLGTLVDVDWVLVWGARVEDAGSPAMEALFGSLEQGYELVEVSQPLGLGLLFRRGEAEAGTSRGGRR